MTKQDLLFFAFALPFLGGFLSFLLGIFLDVQGSVIGIMVLLGVIAGFLALITMILGEQYLIKKHGGH